MPFRLVIALLLLLPLLAAAACARPWRVPFEDWRPYAFIDDQGRHTGLETELLAAIAKEMGCSVEYLPDVPRNRRMPMLVAGDLDLLVAASYDSPNPPESIWFTRPYRNEEFGAFTRADAGLAPGLQTLREVLGAGLRLLAHRGPAVVPIVDEFAAVSRLTAFEDYAKGLQLLALGRGDVLIGDRLAVLFAARGAQLGVRELALPVRRDVVGYKLSRRRFDAADVARFNEVILRLEAQGELRRIRARWLPAGSR
ncbi:MAG TPA: transporter substrate-binding domain-containing protein [Roseateles sp.]